MRKILYCFISLIQIHFNSLLNAQQAYTLPAAIQAARVSNISLKAQRGNIQLAETDKITAGLRPNPVINNQSLQLMQPAYFPANTTWDNERNRQVWWQLTKPFLLPGVRRNRIDYAVINIRQQEYLYQDAEREFLVQVANKWIDAWLAYMRTVLLKKGTEGGNNRKQSQLNDQTGDLLVRQNKIQLRNAETSLENELLELQALLGSAEIVTIDTNLTRLKTKFDNLDSIASKDLSARPDLLFYQGAVESSAANIKLQKSHALPAPELGLIWNPQNTVPYLGFFGTLQIPLFARNQGEIKKSGILKLQAEQFLEYQTVTARGELTKALKNYQMSKRNLSDYSEILAISNLILAKTSGDAGIEAQKSLSDQQIQFYESEANFLRSSVQLLYVTGRLNSAILQN